MVCLDLAYCSLYALPDFVDLQIDSDTGQLLSLYKLLQAILKFQMVYSKHEWWYYQFNLFGSRLRDSLVEWHYQLVTTIPRSYVQLKNMDFQRLHQMLIRIHILKVKGRKIAWNQRESYNCINQLKIWLKLVVEASRPFLENFSFNEIYLVELNLNKSMIWTS